MSRMLKKKRKRYLLLDKKDKPAVKILLRKARLSNNTEWIKVYAELLYTGRLLINDQEKNKKKKLFVQHQLFKDAADVITAEEMKFNNDRFDPESLDEDDLKDILVKIRKAICDKGDCGQYVQTAICVDNLVAEDCETVRISENSRLQLMKFYEMSDNIIMEVPVELDAQFWELSQGKECLYTPMLVKWLRKLKIAYSKKEVKGYVSELKEAVEKAFFELTIWIREYQNIGSISGGKDSVAMLLKGIEEGIKFDRLVFADTGLEFPEMYEYLDKVEKRIGRKIERVKGDVNWDEWFYGAFTKGKNEGRVRGFPPVVGLGCWAKRELKTKPIAKIEGKENVIYLGIAADEKERLTREKYRKKNIYRFPLVEYGMTEQDCLDYLKEQELENPLYEIFGRLGCYLCPKQPLKSLRKIYERYPDLWLKMKKYEKDSPGGFKIDLTLDDLELRWNKKPLQLAFF